MSSIAWQQHFATIHCRHIILICRKEMEDLSWNRPLLYLYSTDDPLCDAVALKELLERKKHRGQDIKSISWENSEHCGHMKVHREEYMNAVKQFLDDIQIRCAKY